MTDEKLRQEIHDAVDRRLSGMREDPWLAARVIEASKGDKPVKKKISASFALILTIILIASMALAAGLGVFGRIANQYDPTTKDRLSGLETVSTQIGTTAATGDGITVQIEQCYYEGDRIFMSYRLSGNLYQAALHEGQAPEKSWDWEEKDMICAESLTSDHPQARETLAYLDGTAPRWTEENEAFLGDGLLLADGTYLDIIGGDTLWQEDGSVIGWKECVIPQDRQAETLEIKAVLYRINNVKAQDEAGFHSATTRGEQTDILFTVRRGSDPKPLSGAFANDIYQTAADFTIGQIDMKGTIRMHCPAEWVAAHDDWEYHSNDDLIETYALYCGDQLISDRGTESESYEKENNVILFGQLYACPESLEGLKLVPIYTKSGAHTEEAIPLQRPINQ